MGSLLSWEQRQEQANTARATPQPFARSRESNAASAQGGLNAPNQASFRGADDQEDSEEVDWLTLQPKKNKSRAEMGRPANSVMAFTPKMEPDNRGGQEASGVSWASRVGDQGANAGQGQRPGAAAQTKPAAKPEQRPAMRETQK